MIKNRLIIIIGLIAFIVIVVGVSYSFFVYNKDVVDVTLNTGDISINLANINGNLTLSNVIPKTDDEGIASTDYIDFTVNATVDTERIYYEVYILPKSGNTLDTSYLKTYLTDQTNSVLTNVTLYNSLPNAQIENGKAIYQGLIQLNNGHTTKNETKNFRLRLWLDANYPGSSAKIFYFDVYLYAKNVDENFAFGPICKRATVLHTEQCESGSASNNNYCYADGYHAEGEKGTDTITYGKLGTSGEPPAVGDAFDCDINGDGLYNSENERFYYVSNYFDTNTESFDTTRATLIYYRNFSGGIASDSGVAYYAGVNENYHGPTTAIAALPNNKANSGTWRNDLLKTQDRKVLSCNNASCTTLYDKTNVGNSPEYPIENPTSPNPPLYNGKAARLLTLKELVAGCGSMSSTNGEISDAGCNFLFEKTKYASLYSYGSYGPWLENPVASNSIRAWGVYGGSRYVSIGYASYSTAGARPAIDVLYTDISY